MNELATRESLVRSLPAGGFVAEVGVLRGAFSAVLLAGNLPQVLYLIDPWQNFPGTQWQNQDPCAQDDHEDNYRHVLATFGGRADVRILRSCSLHAAALFAAGSLDLVYLDADHFQAAADIAAWWPAVKPGGWLSGHDYCTTYCIKVKEAVDQFVARQGLELLTTAEKWFPSWLVRKPE